MTIGSNMDKDTASGIIGIILGVGAIAFIIFLFFLLNETLGYIMIAVTIAGFPLTIIYFFGWKGFKDLFKRENDEDKETRPT
jgi:hypothetical protein